MNTPHKTKVLVVDDSALMRRLVTEILSSDPSIEVVGSAADPYVARDKIMSLKPDVLTLDVEMPRMDGLTFLSKLMASRPMPVVMVSSLTEKGCETTLKALELGAIDFVSKPKVDLTSGMTCLSNEIVEKVKTAARANVRRLQPASQSRSAVPPCGDSLITSTHKVIAIGASTGGTEALAELLQSLPPDSPGIAAVIHMPAGFTKKFAKRLDERCVLTVAEAQNGDVILPGHVLLAPGNFHMEIRRGGAKYAVKVREGDRIKQHRPSVDVLFESAAKYLGSNGIGVILTGMGDDGADGMLAMHKAGAATIAQDEASCVVFGMPKEAINRGGVDQVMPLKDIGAGIIDVARKMAETV